MQAFEQQKKAQQAQAQLVAPNIHELLVTLQTTVVPHSTVAVELAKQSTELESDAKLSSAEKTIKRLEYVLDAFCFGKGANLICECACMWICLRVSACACVCVCLPLRVSVCLCGACVFQFWCFADYKENKEHTMRAMTATCGCKAGCAEAARTSLSLLVFAVLCAIISVLTCSSAVFSRFADCFDTGEGKVVGSAIIAALPMSLFASTVASGPSHHYIQRCFVCA